MSESAIERLDQALNNKIRLPDGREVEVQPMKASRAIAYLRRYGDLLSVEVVDDGKISAPGLLTSIETMGSLLTDLFKELGIEEELGRLEYEQAVEAMRDFFGSLTIRHLGAIGLQFRSTAPSGSQSNGSPQTGEAGTAPGSAGAH